MSDEEKDQEIKLDPPFTMILCASSGSGKTYLLKHLLKKDLKDKFDNVFIMCPSLEYSTDYDEFKSKERYKKRMFGSYDPEIIDEIIAEQKYVIKKFGKDRCPQTLLILDDCMEYLQGNHTLVQNIFFKGRHINLSCIILVQKLKGISTIMRINTKYVIFFRTGNSAELDHLLEEFSGKKERKIIEAELVKWFQQPYSFLLCDLKTQDFTRRYALGLDCKIVKYIDWYSVPV